MQDFLRAPYDEKTLPKPVGFKIDALSITGDYCYIKYSPTFKDGSDAIAEFLPDIGYMHCMKRGKAGWKGFVMRK